MQPYKSFRGSLFRKGLCYQANQMCQTCLGKGQAPQVKADGEVGRTTIQEVEPEMMGIAAGWQYLDANNSAVGEWRTTVAITRQQSGSAALLRNGQICGPKTLPLLKVMQHRFCCAYSMPSFMQPHRECAEGKALWEVGWLWHSPVCSVREL